MQVLLGSTFKDAKDEMMMEVNEEYLQIGDKTMIRRTKTENPATLRNVISQALIVMQQGERLTWQEQEKRGDLRIKIKAAVDPCDLTSDEIVMIKPLIALLGDVLITHQAVKMLEGKMCGKDA